MKRSEWISGDGGPLIILQKSVCAYWQDASDFENSKMNGGAIETDYDKICQCTDSVTVLNCYDHDMIVLTDSEWAGRFYPSDANEAIVIQSFGAGDNIHQIVNRCRNDQPTKLKDFVLKDQTMRLLVGAESGDAEEYGYAEITITPGKKVCAIYFDNVKFERIKRVLAKSKGELAKRSRFQGLKEAMSLDLRERVRLSRCLTTSSAAC